MSQDEIDIAVIKSDVKYLVAQVADLKQLIQTNYVTKEEFIAIKDRVSLIYKAVFFVLSAVTLAILGAVFKQIFK